MDVSLFDYVLPPASIAQSPPERRDASRMLVMDRSGGRWSHHRFREFAEFLRPGDLVVVNDAQVVPCRLWGQKATGGRVEFLVMRPAIGWPAPSGQEHWFCLLRASRRPRLGQWVSLPDGMAAAIVEEREHGEAVVAFRAAAGRGGAGHGSTVARLLEACGRMPLPPYIRRDPTGPPSPDDRARYQTIFAACPGAVAAPTAGLHFTADVLADLAARDIAVSTLTLLVGPGTFRPVSEARVEDHVLVSERFSLPASTATSIRRTRENGGRVVACGTTVVRVLEACAVDGGRVRSGEGDCRLFVTPGHSFRVVDALLTNFHLPRSTLLMLVSAFASREAVLDAYRAAVRHAYRFYSYGDAMLILPAGEAGR
ncbi:MAG: tRNA preQ1(34) S-adenosylmethionine ribosyltransferase-isomerase QueA [Acidobacteriota bacterium]